MNVMINPILRTIGLMSIVTLLTTSCGGGGSSGGVGGAAGTTVSIGEITGFGSVIVNGKRYETSGARRVVDGVEQSGSADDQSVFKEGMVAAVVATGDGNSPSASLIVVEDVIKGLVTDVAADGSSITVLGQTVRIADPQQVLDEGIASPAALDGRDVEVHGLVVGPGVVDASLIEDKGAPGSILTVYRVRGIVTPGSGTATELFIGSGLRVDFSACAPLVPSCIRDMPADPADWDNLLVEAKGNPADFVDGSPDVLIATEVEPAGLPDGVELGGADDAEIEGFVVEIVSPVCDSGDPIAGEFVLGGLGTVRTTTATRFEGGLCEELILGAKVEVEGPAATPLVATEIKFKDPVKLEGDVATKVGNDLTLEGLPGVTITVNAQTEYKDAADLGDIAAPNHVRIRGRATGPNTVVATKVEKRGDASEEDLILQGPVDASPAPSDPSLYILGVFIDTGPISDANFEGPDDSVLGRGGFFATVVPGNVVKAQGKRNGGSVAWDEIELED
jgi:hypothetical protein